MSIFCRITGSPLVQGPDSQRLVLLRIPHYEARSFPFFSCVRRPKVVDLHRISILAPSGQAGTIVVINDSEWDPRLRHLIFQITPIELENSYSPRHLCVWRSDPYGASRWPPASHLPLDLTPSLPRALKRPTGLLPKRPPWLKCHFLLAFLLPPTWVVCILTSPVARHMLGSVIQRGFAASRTQGLAAGTRCHAGHVLNRFSFGVWGGVGNDEAEGFGSFPI